MLHCVKGYRCLGALYLNLPAHIYIKACSPAWNVFWVSGDWGGAARTVCYREVTAAQIRSAPVLTSHRDRERPWGPLSSWLAGTTRMRPQGLPVVAQGDLLERTGLTEPGSSL